MRSDLTTATALARAAIKGALANVEINLGSLKADTPEDEGFQNQVKERLAALESAPP